MILYRYDDKTNRETLDPSPIEIKSNHRVKKNWQEEEIDDLSNIEIRNEHDSK